MTSMAELSGCAATTLSGRGTVQCAMARSPDSSGEMRSR